MPNFGAQYRRGGPRTWEETMYATIITEATGVTDPAMLRRIEDYMRQDIFHSTLDWQSRAQLQRAAKAAQREIPLLDELIAQRAAA